MVHTELNVRERPRIEDMLNAKMSVGEIAADIGRHKSTVYREIKRNFYHVEEIPDLNGYYGLNAQDYATDRRARRRKLVRLDELRTAVIMQLKEGWSPEQIAARFQFEDQTIRVSHETIYAYVCDPDGQPRELARYLPNRRKKRRSHHSRKTRFAVLFRNNYRSTTHLMNCLMSVMERVPQPARKSITFDRGNEFRDWRKLKPGIGTESCFFDPQAPWQKGSVENLNKRERRYLPRDAPAATLTDRDMKSICDRLNGTLRKCLGWRTPTEAFREEIMKLR